MHCFETFAAWLRPRASLLVPQLINPAGLWMVTVSNPNLGHHNPHLLVAGRSFLAIAMILNVRLLIGGRFSRKLPSTKAV